MRVDKESPTPATIPNPILSSPEISTSSGPSSLRSTADRRRSPPAAVIVDSCKFDSIARLIGGGPRSRPRSRGSSAAKALTFTALLPQSVPRPTIARSRPQRDDSAAIGVFYRAFLTPFRAPKARTSRRSVTTRSPAWNNYSTNVPAGDSPIEPRQKSSNPDSVAIDPCVHLVAFRRGKQ